MHQLSLPTAEETSVEITVGGVVFTIDYFDHQQYVEAAFKEMKVAGESSNVVLADCLRAIYKTKHNADMSIGTTMYLMAEFAQIEEVLKKKYSSLRELFDTTDSPGPQETPETSISSTTPESE